jgi:hypothetical protein
MCSVATEVAAFPAELIERDAQSQADLARQQADLVARLSPADRWSRRDPSRRGARRVLTLPRP